MPSDKNVVVNFDLKGVEKALNNLTKALENIYNLQLEIARHNLQKEKESEKVREAPFSLEEPTDTSDNIVHARRQGDDIPLCEWGGENDDFVTTGEIGRGQMMCPDCLKLLQG